MKRLFLSVATVLGIVVFCSPASAQTAPTRHLVYNYTVGVQSHSTVQTSMYDSGSGSSTLGGGGSDKGQILVDVNGVEPDGGLVVTVSENSQGNRSAKAATCVVYPDTSVVCGAGDVHPEEEAVIRTLSPKFFNASALDANRHWQVSNASAGLKIDFTANPKSDGVTVGIVSELVQKSANGNSMESEGKYDYNTSKFIPTTLSEYQTLHQQNGAGGGYALIVVDTTATLASDSGIAKT